MSNVTRLPDWEVRCIRVACNRFTKLINVRNWLRDQHHIQVDQSTLLFFNPYLK